MSDARGGDRLLISVVVPTYNRVPQLLQLLRGLAGQTLDPRRFEVLVSDDGSTDPVREALEQLELPYPLTYLTQANAGPAAARNRAIERAGGLLTLILNDDAVPDADLLRVHLTAHSRRRVPVAVLGSFPFVERSLQRPFVRLIEETDLIFNFVSMRAGGLYDWRFFWTCNISLQTRLLSAAGGFDECFRDPMCEDIELGYRLGKLQVPVLYLPEARCLHDHDIDPLRFARRQECLGRNLVQMCELHPEPEMARTWGLGRLDAAAIHAVERLVTAETPQAERDLQALQAFDREPLPDDDAAAARRVAEMEPVARRLSRQRCRAGMVQEWLSRHGRPENRAPCAVTAPDADPPTRDLPTLTSVIIPCIDGLEHTLPCLDSIARHTPEPHEVIVVDNGSGPATLRALRARPDIRLLEMGRNVGAPVARNRGIEIARGDALVFLDNDTRVPPNWLAGLAAHTRVNPRVGLVGPMSNKVSGPQLVADADYDPRRLDAYACAFAERRRGQHRYVIRLILFCLYVRREVVNLIGGFDPAFGRWGFEDDDFCLRAALAGYRLRVAEDVFVHHTGSSTSVTARIDYAALLERNWRVFKEKWRIDAALAYGAPYPLQQILSEPFDPARHVVPLDAAIGVRS